MTEFTWESTWGKVKTFRLTAEKVQQLYYLGWNFNQVDENNNTILHKVAGWIKTPVLEAFLDCGSRVDVQNRYHETPLFFAIQNNNTQNFQLLLSRGANRNVVNSAGLSPLYFALLEKGNYVEDLAFFMTTKLRSYKKLNPNQLNARKNNPLQEVLETVPDKFLQIPPQRLKLLFELGLNADNQNKFQDTLMHMVVRQADTFMRKGESAQKQFKQLFFTLLEQNPNMNIPNSRKETALDLLKTEGQELVPLLTEFTRRQQTKCATHDSQISSAIIDQQGREYSS